MGKTKAQIVEGFWSDAGTFETLLKCCNFESEFFKKKKLNNQAKKKLNELN